MDFFSDLLPPLAVQVGVACVTGQVFLHGIFAYVLPAGPWKELPSFTAHQAVCLPLMMYLSYQGFVAWFLEQEELGQGGMESRIFGVSQRGADLGSVVLGMMLFWDIPVSLVTKDLHDMLMLVHHIGMLFVSGIVAGVFSSGGHPVGSYYAPFFFGMIEFSTIFLSLVDVFHPKHRAWHQWLRQNTNPLGDRLRSINELSRVCFAISYLMLRMVYFPIIMFTTCLRDFYGAALLPEEERFGTPGWALLGVCLLALGFTVLQINWGVLVAKQVAKAVGLLPDKKVDTAKSK